MSIIIIVIVIIFIIRKACLQSTVLADFKKVFCLTYPQQKFANMPEHIQVVDANRVMAFSVFQKTLRAGSQSIKDFIAVLSDILKLGGAGNLPEVQAYSACTTFDCDTLWQRKAMPPMMAFGHASATVAIDRRVREGWQKELEKLERLTYEFCKKARDFSKIAKPFRWPKGSPALESLILRISPLIPQGGGWIGGFDDEIVMNTAWDTYNNWGLRNAFNENETYKPAPRSALDKLLQAPHPCSNRCISFIGSQQVACRNHVRTYAAGRNNVLH